MNASNNKGLFQILFNIVIIGIFSIVENVLLFYYNGTWHMPVIFSGLSILMYCVLAINIYNCLHEIFSEKKEEQNPKMQEILQQMKKMEDEIQELKMTQLRSTKAILQKEEEIQKSMKQ